MATAFDFVEDAPAVSGDFDFQPDPEESPSERPIIPAPGEPTPSMAQAPPLSPFEAGQIPTRVAQAQAAGPVPELTGGEIEQMVMTPQVTIPNVIPESWPIARGLFQTAKSIPEFLTAPAAPYVLMAQQIPLVREAVDAAMGAGMVKSAAELTGEASVTGDREKMTEAIGSGLLGATMLGAPHVAPMIVNEIAARRVGPPDLARVDVEAFPGPANMIQIPHVVEQAQRGGLFRQKALQGAKTVTAPVQRGARPVVPETPPEIERGLTVIQEIRAKGADTKEKIRALFPQLSRETAAKLRNQAFPKERIPDNLSRQDVDRLFLDKLNEESNREIQQAFQENTGEPVAQVPITPEPTPPPESPPMAPEAKAPTVTPLFGGMFEVSEPPVAPGYIRLYRGEPGKPPTWSEEVGKVVAPEELRGRWFTPDKNYALYYASDASVKFPEGASLKFIDVPEGTDLTQWSPKGPLGKNEVAGKELIVPESEAQRIQTAPITKRTVGEPTPPAKVEAPVEVLEPAPASIIVQTPYGLRRVTVRAKLDPDTGKVTLEGIQLYNDQTGSYEVFNAPPTTRTFATLDDAAEAGFDLVRSKFKEVATIPEQAQAEAPAAKEPWQMTRQQYRDKEATGFDSLSTMPEGKDIVGMPVKKAGEHKVWQDQQKAMAEQTRSGKNETVDLMHKRLVQKAIEKGKPVPPEVLAEYPDLAPKPAAKPAAETGEEVGAPDFIAGLAKRRPEGKVGGIIWDIEQGRTAGLKAKELYRQVGDNRAVISINGQRFVIDNVARLKDAGIETDWTTRKTTPSSVKTVGEWNDYLAKYPKLGLEQFKRYYAKEAKPPETPPTGPGISNGPGAAGYGTPGTYSPISALTDQMATSPVKNLREAIGVGERISDSWARGKDAFSRALGKLRVVPGALKRSWRNIRDLNEVEERVSALDWVLQQSSAKSKIAGETIRKAIPASQVRDAMAIWIDSGGDEAAIRTTLNNLPTTTTPRVRRALEAALTLPDNVKTHASNLSDYYARRAQEAQAEDVLHGVLEDYFTHVWKKPANMPDSVKAALNTGRVNEYFQYARQRKIPTLLEGILQGKEPVLDPAEVIPHYNYLMDRAIASRRFIKSLEDAKMPDGKPVLGMWGTRAVVGDPGEGAILIKLRGRPEDYNNYRQIDHPAFRKWKWAATDEEGRPVFYEGTLAVHPEAYERLARMMDRSRLTAAKVTRALLRVSGEVKGAKLGLLSPFHQVHLGSHALGHWTNPFFNLREIDWDAPATRFAVEKAGLKLAANPAELANFAEGILSPGLVHKIPLIGPLSKAYSEWLFTDYLPRLKLKTFENAWARNRAFYDKQIRTGKITEEQLAMRVGDAINNAYGELNQLWLGKHGRDPRLQRALRLGFLAPDFGEARLRFVGKALKSYSLEEKLALGTLFTTLYMGARVGNILTHGDPEFQDWKHAFAVKQGNRWYSMRSVLGDTLHAFANFPNFLYVRLNPAYARGIMEFFTGRDITGRKRTAGEQVLDELKQVVPIHLGGLTRDDQHVWESFLMAIGVGSQRAAPTVEVSQLASDWRKRRGIESRAETLSDPNSPYRKARIALEFGNRQDFHDAIRELTRQHQARGDRTPRASIRRAFEEYYIRPFSGNARLEPAFKASLGTREQRKYQDALIERRRLLQKFQEWY